jgi:hypothetical protein
VQLLFGPNQFYVARQTKAFAALVETVTTPPANHGEASIFPDTINSLNDLLPTTLNDVATAGPGDATWALQWDFNLAAVGIGSSVQISKDKRLELQVIPEPSVLGLLSLGLAAAAFRHRRNAA